MRNLRSSRAVSTWLLMPGQAKVELGVGDSKTLVIVVDSSIIVLLSLAIVVDGASEELELVVDDSTSSSALEVLAMLVGTELDIEGDAPFLAPFVVPS